MKSIIFDLDGTLWDSSESVADSWSATLQRLDIPQLKGLTLTADDLKSGMGMTMTALAKKYFPMLDSRRQLEVLEICMKEENEYIAVNGGRLFDNERQTLEKLKENNRLFIVSNCQCGYIEAFLTYTGFDRYFEGYMCWGDTKQPKSFTINALIEKYRCVDPVYVGDTQGDCDSVFDAKVPFIHAGYGFGEISTPDRVLCTADSFSELERIFSPTL